MARTSVRVTAGSGRVSEVSSTTALPLTSGGASRDTRPSSDEVSGATTPTTPVASGMVKLKYGRRDRVAAAQDLGDLVGPAGVPDPAVDGPVDERPGARRRRRPRPRRPRRRTGRAGPPSARPRGTGPGRGSWRSCAAQPGWALRAARTASRRSLRDARQALASGVPSARADEVRAAALRARERPADVQLVGLADLDPGAAASTSRRAISGPPGGRRRAGRAGRPRARSRIPCSRRTARSGRSG